MSRKGTIGPSHQETLEKDDHVSDDGGRKGNEMDFLAAGKERDVLSPPLV